MNAIRILFDTCTIRNLLYPDGLKVDIDAILTRIYKYRISLADGAFAELISQLVTHRISFFDWSNYASELNRILDQEWPIFPGGKDLSVMAGLQKDLDSDLNEVKQARQAAWKLLRDANCERTLLSGTIYRDTKGRLIELPVNPVHIEEAMQGARKTWIDRIEEIQRMQHEDPTRFSSLEKTEIFVRGDLGKAITDPPDLLDRLNAYVKLQSHFAWASINSKTPYDPSTKKNRSDLFDMALLMAIPLPAIVVTADTKFIRTLTQTKTVHAKQVIDIQEFNQHVVDDTLDALLSHWGSESDEQA